jgi:hypothetical protein
MSIFAGADFVSCPECRSNIVADSEVEGNDTFLVRAARRVASVNLVEAGEGGRIPEMACR